MEAPWVERDLYVFVLDFRGNIWVNGAFPQAIGTNAMGAIDPEGRLYIVEMLTLAAKAGEGWVEYRWISPCDGAERPKHTFFRRVGPFVVAVGAYRAP